MTASNNELLSLIDPELFQYGIALGAHQREHLNRFVILMETWNRRINLTGAKNHLELMRRHILDCLMLEQVPRASGRIRWIDIGSGGGLPSFPLAILHPDDLVTSVETVGKKVTFQQYAARELGLKNLTILNRDIFQIARETALEDLYDVVVARAFKALPVLLELAAQLLPPGGQLWAMKGARWREELAKTGPDSLAAFTPVPEQFDYALGDTGGSGTILVWTRLER